MQQQPADRHGLALAARQFYHRVIDARQMHAELFEQLDRLLAHTGVIELRNEAEQLGLQLAAEEYVLRNVQCVDQAQALVQAADADLVGVARGAQLDGSAVDFDAAAVGRLGAGQRLD